MKNISNDQKGKNGLQKCPFIGDQENPFLSRQEIHCMIRKGFETWKEYTFIKVQATLNQGLS